MKFLKKQGFSLLSVVIGLSMASILSLGIMQLITDFEGHIKKSENKLTELSLVGQLTQVISDNMLCKNALDVGISQKYVNSANLDFQLKLPGNKIIGKGLKFGSQLLIKEFYIKDLQTPIDIGPSVKKAIGNLYLKTEDASGKAVVRKEKSVGVVQITFNSATNEIFDCVGSANDPKQMCESLGLVWSVPKSSCQQDPDKACTDLGGNWNGSRCIASQVSSDLNIKGKNCPAGQYLSGFDSTGSPMCQALPVAANTNTTNTNTTNTNTTNTVTAQETKRCPSGYTDIDSPDRKRKCHFEWAEAATGISVGCGTGISCSPGGYGTGRCDSDGNWAGSTYTCQNESVVSCVGGYETKSSADKTNSCFFKWNQGSEGDNLVVTQATGGGTLSGKCNSTGAWTFSYNCPGKTVTCPAGQITVGRCNFAYDNTPVGQSALNLRDINAVGKASGCTCKSDGSYDINSCIVSGCE